MKYHISKSGNPAQCRATKKGCPLGADAPHFDSKDAARNYIEKSAANNHQTLKSMSKNRGIPNNLKKILSKYNASEETISQSINRGITTSSFEFSWEYDAYDENPYSGRYLNFDGIDEVDLDYVAQNISQELTNSNSDSSDARTITPIIKQLLVKYHFDDLDNYTVDYDGGYYNDEVSKVTADERNTKELTKEIVKLIK